MGRSWTKEQLSAITSSGENIIVSAGAGSGKTAVLTERVITKIKQGVKLNELLVLTFTNAAALEMKERVRRALKKENLTDSLDLIDSSYITTFDAFALSVVKKYHYLLNVTPNVSIVDSSIIRIKKQEYLDKIMDLEYEKLDDNFKKLISDFCLKDDKNIKEAILKISDKLDLLYDKKEYLVTYIDTYFKDTKIDQDVNEYIKLIKRKIQELGVYLELFEHVVENDYYLQVTDALEPLLEATTYDEIKLSLDYKIPNLPRNSDEEAKNIKKQLGEVLAEIKKLCNYDSVDVMKEGIVATKPYIKAIISIIASLDDYMNEYKHYYDLYEFGDIAKMAIRIVKENDDVKKEFRDNFHEILVDEYQDTSDLQELFITEISNNNVYMVGDIKQSIYRFRNANPKIFKEKYDSYKDHIGGMKIDLNKNFRSRNTVLDGINEIFNAIMDDEVGGANYRKEHQLCFGNTAYVENGTTNQNMELEIYNYQVDKELPYKVEEVEAFIIAKDIKEKVENHYQVFDKDEGILRDIRYSDFAILIDQKKNFELYKKIFTYFNIPIEINKDETLTNSIVISVIKHILNLIIKKEIDTEFLFSYTSVARSFLFSIADEDIYKRVTNRDFSKDILIDKINELKEIKDRLTSRMLIEKIIKIFDIYEKMITIGDIDENFKRLDYLMELADNLTNMGYDVELFTNYLKQIFKEQIEIKYSMQTDSSDSVKIMTIHKSKGLEFYVCYFPEMNHKFNIRDITERFLFSSEYGIITPYYKEGIRNTIYPSLIKEHYLFEEVSEKLRVFYVALTRAKEKMIILCDLNKETTIHKNKGVVSPLDRLKYRSFRDVLLSVKDDVPHFITPYALDTVPLTKEYQKKSLKEYHNSIYTDNYIVEELDIACKKIEKGVYSHKKHNLQTYEESLLLEAGNYLHFLLEVVDLKNPNISMLPIKEVHRERLYAFLNQDILDDVMDAKVYKEYEFIYNEDDKKMHGIIDLLLVYKDKVKIIDYKLKNINKKDYNEQLKGYKYYMEKIMQKPVSVYLYSILDGVYKEVI